MKKVYFLLCSVLVFTQFSFAVTKTWTGGNGTWSTGSNWSGGTAPTSLDDVVFNTSVTVTVDGSKTVNSLTITSNATVVFNGSNTTTTITMNCPACTSSIDAGSTLTVAGTTAANKCELTLANTALFNINGTLNLGTATQTATQRLIPVAGTVTTVTATGRLNIVGAGASVSGSTTTNFVVNGIQDMQKNSGLFSVGNYALTATNIISGSTTTMPTFTSSQTTTWGNIEVNAPANTHTGGGPQGLFSSNAICQNFTVTNTGTGNCTIAASGTTTRTITVNGNLSVSAGAIVNLNSTTAGSPTATSGFDVKGTMNIAGTITENGTATGSIVRLNGTSAQSVTYTGSATNDVSFEINNAAGVTVTSNWSTSATTNSRLFLTSGNIDMGTNTLFLQNPATTALSGGTVGSHIIGKFRRATNTAAAAYVFPISDNAANLASVKIYPITAVSDFTVQFIRPNTFDRLAVTSPILNAGNYYWDIQQTTGTGSDPLNFSYANFFNGGITDPTAVRGLHWNGASWDNLGGTDAGSSSVDVPNVTTFSPFSLGSTLNVLPVSFASFSGYRDGSRNQLRWTTATEMNNRGFDVQRSADGINYISIGFVNSLAQGGSSTDVINYNFTDNAPTGSKQYYRLRQEDFDGRSKLSNIVLIRGNKPSSLTIDGVFPNPASTVVNVLIATPKKDIVTLLLSDMAGRTISQKVVNVETGSNTVSIGTDKLAGGTYMVRLICTDGCEGGTVKFVKQ